MKLCIEKSLNTGGDQRMLSAGKRGGATFHRNRIVGAFAAVCVVEAARGLAPDYREFAAERDGKFCRAGSPLDRGGGATILARWATFCTKPRMSRARCGANLSREQPDAGFFEPEFRAALMNLVG